MVEEKRGEKIVDRKMFSVESCRQTLHFSEDATVSRSRMETRCFIVSCSRGGQEVSGVQYTMSVINDD